MKLTELSFADYAAIELHAAMLKHSHFFGSEPEAAMARAVYRHADALSAHRDTRNGVRHAEAIALRQRAETAERSLEIFQALGDYPARVALYQLWELLGAAQQTEAVQHLRSLQERVAR